MTRREFDRWLKSEGACPEARDWLEMERIALAAIARAEGREP